MGFPLSILDVSPVLSGSTSTQALKNTLDLARFADRRGFTRYWLAEHHNSPGIASTSPDIMIGQVARETEHIRVGSGGVMLPNHAPLKVAENFKLLEALYPDRIDLGIGRAPGTDGRTAMALRRSQDVSGDDFPKELAELQAFASDGFPAGHFFTTVKAYPQDVPLPPIWLLGSSGFSSQLAAMVGTGFSFAHHINGEFAVQAMTAYRREFQPSTTFPQPHSILAASIIVADTDEEAADLALSVAFAFFSLQAGIRSNGLLSPEAVKAHPVARQYWDALDSVRERAIFGSPETVRARLDQLIEETQADELMALTMVYDHEARIHSYDLLAGAYEVEAVGQVNLTRDPSP